ncbi:hypothetical protein HBI24_209210 [Parastagonospora nodorum]|nr:hypothetical protein HBH42_232310 [Parastagonospora nodorum]KAH4190181.1 hypothetical protein HBI95_218670 [Parastagonospora nodorum]KAH4952561.1 hypothetical protein HBI78_239270 [Parastagonospora nodorum]KAH5002755.1 hypothetical protein HBI74_239500 [Parastagonospora nodorum]KAH5104266.1 hypothetical protein HBH71_212580 [Parastagonospora nodorum]
MSLLFRDQHHFRHSRKQIRRTLCRIALLLPIFFLVFILLRYMLVIPFNMLYFLRRLSASNSTPDLYQASPEAVEFTPRPIDRAHVTDFPDFMGYRPSDARTVSWVDRDL